MESRDSKPSLRDKVGLGLFMGLRLMKEQAITHRGACSLSSLKKRATLDILRQGFSYKRTFMKNLNPKKKSLAHFSQKECLKRERESS